MQIKEHLVTTVRLLQCKTNFFIRLCFWEASIHIQKKFFLIRLHSSTFV